MRLVPLLALALALPLALGLASAGCQGPYVPPPPPQGTRACDPLAVAPPPPVTLATIIAAGRGEDGAVYVVDTTSVPGSGLAGERRAFVGTGNALERKTIAVASETEADLTLSLNTAADFQIKVEHTGYAGPVTRMGIFRGGLSAAATFNLDLEGEVLTLMAASELSSFTITSIAGVEIMYAGTASDGRRLVVTQPTVDFTLDKLRVFYGTPDRMIERTLAENGAIVTSFTSLIFDVDGVKTIAHLTFPQSAETGAGATGGAARIEQNNQTIATLTPVPGSPGAPASPKPPASTFTTGLAFLCL